MITTEWVCRPDGTMGAIANPQILVELETKPVPSKDLILLIVLPIILLLATPFTPPSQDF